MLLFRQSNLLCVTVEIQLLCITGPRALLDIEQWKRLGNIHGTSSHYVMTMVTLGMFILIVNYVVTMVSPGYVYPRCCDDNLLWYVYPCQQLCCNLSKSGYNTKWGLVRNQHSDYKQRKTNHWLWTKRGQKPVSALPECGYQVHGLHNEQHKQPREYDNTRA